MVTFDQVWQLFGAKALSCIFTYFYHKLYRKIFVGRQFPILIFAYNHRVLPYELDVALFGPLVVFPCFVIFIEKSMTKSSKNRIFARPNRLPNEI